MTSNAPVPSGGFDPISFEGSSGVMPQRPTLRIDHGSGEHSQRAGSFTYCKAVIQDVTIVLAARREFRKFYAADFNTDPKAPVVCQSWNGKYAFGRGGRDPKEPFKERDCKTCKHCHGDGKDWCAPQATFFGMLIHADSDVWTPFFADIKGANMRPWGQAFASATTKALTTQKRREDGTVVPTKPSYVWALKPRLERIPKKSGYATVFPGEPMEVPLPDGQFIARFLAEQGTAMWKADIQASEADARALGSQERQADVSTAKPANNDDESGPRSYDQVPF